MTKQIPRGRMCGETADGRRRRGTARLDMNRIVAAITHKRSRFWCRHESILTGRDTRLVLVEEQAFSRRAVAYGRNREMMVLAVSQSAVAAALCRRTPYLPRTLWTAGAEHNQRC